MTTLYQNFIDGRFTPADPGTAIDVHNPATHALLARTPTATPDEVNAAVDAARRAQPAWERTPAIQRAGNLLAIAAKLNDVRDSQTVSTPSFSCSTRTSVRLDPT